MDARELLADVRLVPVVVIESADTAVPLARTLLAAGIGAIEITLRTPAALEAIAAVAAEVPEIICGAGSVRRCDQLENIRKAGARFAVCPGSSPELLKAAQDFPFVPGAETATEMIGLLDAGYILQKFFPAELIGGLSRINALSAPLPDVLFFPTGGIDATLAPQYLAHPRVHCIGGSWFVAKDALAAADYDAIGNAAAEAVQVTR